MPLYCASLPVSEHVWRDHLDLRMRAGDLDVVEGGDVGGAVAEQQGLDPRVLKEPRSRSNTQIVVAEAILMPIRARIFHLHVNCILSLRHSCFIDRPLCKYVISEVALHAISVDAYIRTHLFFL